MMVHECRLAARVYGGFAALLLVLCLACVVCVLARTTFDSSFLKEAGGFSVLFGTLPVQRFFAARAQRNQFLSLRSRWRHALEENDLPRLKELREEELELRKLTFSKPFWSIT
jgi:hypothetical protein